MEEKNIISKFVTFVKNSPSLKMVVILFIVLALLIPVTMVQSLIKERGYRQSEVVGEISSKWGTAQTIGGPVLSIPYRTLVKEKGKAPIAVTRYVHLLPDSLQIKGSMEPELLYRGIYEALLYRSNLEVQGTFSSPNFERLDLDMENILWEKAFISMGITDMGGIRDLIRGKVAGVELLLEPGIDTNDVFSSGVSGSVAIDRGLETIPFSFTVGINGCMNLQFLPLGKHTNVSISSNWPDPSFTGGFLPDQREIDSSGFTAKWSVLHLNRNYPQSWLGARDDLQRSAFGVSLHSGADVYQKTTRTAKYGVMFILFTFTAFFLAEIINKNKIHPIQYFLIGAAVIVFYVLLLAISEHLGFNASFLLSASQSHLHHTEHRIS